MKQKIIDFAIGFGISLMIFAVIGLSGTIEHFL